MRRISPPLLPLAVLLLYYSPLITAQEFGQWCGKYYQVGAPIPDSRPAGSLFPYPELSSSPLLDFQCSTASSIYIEGDDQYDPPMILIDTNITNDVGQPYDGSFSSQAQVDIWSDGHNLLASGSVSVNSMGNLIPFKVSSLTPRQTPYNITCRAQIGNQIFSTNTTLRYLPPNPYGGNTVKVDRRSGALIIRNETSGQKNWERIIPFGFYDSYNATSDPAIYGPGFGSDPVTDTLNRLHLAKSLGFNFVHPVPPGGFRPFTFDDAATAQFEQYVATAASLGLYIQYDMRNSFLNLSSVQYQVEYLRNRSNILMWYTGDEPDGADYDLNATELAYNLIYQIDGYHPVSLVLNCENYFFIEYGLNGADVVMVDPYPIAMNARWSKPYNTYVDENFGDSGCDNCNGTFYDISTRIEATRNRARLQGAWRTKPAWIVPQSFNDGQQEFWYRVPFGQEGEAVTSILAWNHGAMGHASWNSQYSSMDLLGNASEVAHLLYNQSRFLVDHADSRKEILTNLSFPGINGYDVSSWTIPSTNSSSGSGSEVLVMAVNQNYGPNDAGPTWQGIFTLANFSGTLKEVLYGNVTAMEDGTPIFRMGRTSVAAVILEK